MTPVQRPNRRPAAAGVLADFPKVPLVVSGIFAVYILIWFLEVGLRISLLGAMRIEFVVGGLLGVLAMALIATRHESNASSLTPFVFAYLIFLTLHLAISQFFDFSWKFYVDRIVKYSCMTLFAYAFVRNPFTLRLFMGALLLAVMKIGQEAFLGKVTGSMVWENQGIMRLHGTQGSMFGHPNSLAGLAVSVLPFIYYFWPTVEKYFRLALLVLLAFAVNMIVFAGSRTGYVAALMVVGFIFFRSGAKMKFLAAACVVGVLALPFVPHQYVERFMSSFSGKEAEGSSKEARMELAADAWQIFLDNPQGVGINGFAAARFSYLGHNFVDAHNLYLQILADIGIEGLVIFGLFIFALLRELWRNDRRLEQLRLKLVELARGSPSPDVRRHLGDVAFMQAVSSSFLAFIIVRLVLGIFGHDLYEMYWWLSAGVAMAVTNMVPIAEKRAQALAAAAPAVAAEAVPAGTMGRPLRPQPAPPGAAPTFVRRGVLR